MAVIKDLTRFVLPTIQIHFELEETGLKLKKETGRSSSPQTVNDSQNAAQHRIWNSYSGAPPYRRPPHSFLVLTKSSGLN